MVILTVPLVIVAVSLTARTGTVIDPISSPVPVSRGDKAAVATGVTVESKMSSDVTSTLQVRDAPADTSI
jgi:hypothetical protein